MVPSVRRRLNVQSGPVGRGLDRIREEFKLPSSFSPAIEREVELITSAAEMPGGERLDATHLPLIAIDPPGARDLDQAFHLERTADGFCLHYCISDIGSMIEPDSALDREARSRGVTVYMPGEKVPLHPPTLSEGAVSLLADDRARPALWWRLTFDDAGEMTERRVDRAMVRCREAISYVEAQRRIDAGDSGALGNLALLGPLRQQVEARRGGVSLELPEQEVDVADDGSVTLRFAAPVPVEEWNAQMSLATGMAAAQIMLDAGVGILRTMPKPEAETIEDIRRVSLAMGVAWPDDMTYPDWVKTLDLNTTAGLALMNQAAKGLRGAGFIFLDCSFTEIYTHSAVAAPYAHVTAPLRRLVDRFCNEIVLAASAGQRPPAWVLDALFKVPEMMASADRRAKDVDRAVVDLVEAAILNQRVGETLRGVVIGSSKFGAVVQMLDEPMVSIVRRFNGEPGQLVNVRVKGADLARRTVELVVVD